ncbi:MAG: DUF3786 domain-containing protein [Candidatus Omnitrophica bacterium]|nr:DUF3786 domain-containing protein [Candidatus Omnitrophota bacterium]
MGYDVALNKSWEDLINLTKENNLEVGFLADNYAVDAENRRILSLSCNVPAKEYLSILILHYLSKKIKGLPIVSGEWIDFRQLDGGQGYYPTFKTRVISVIIKKYGANPQELLKLNERFNAKKSGFADAGVVFDAFDKVPILIEVWKADEEFGAEANLLFDKSIKDIFCTEDIVILAEFIAHNI